MRVFCVPHLINHAVGGGEVSCGAWVKAWVARGE